MTFEERLAYIGTMKYDYEQLAITYPDKTTEELKQWRKDKLEEYYNGGNMNCSLLADKLRYIITLRQKYGVTK